MHPTTLACRSARTGRFLASALALAALAPACWGAVPYTFTTGSTHYGSASGPGPWDAFGAAASVSGQFDYDESVTPGVVQANGALRYDHSMLILSGQVQGWSFSDPFGYAMIGDDKYQPPGVPLPPLVDILQFGADPAPTTVGTHNFSGFSVLGAYTLVNVRLFWIEGQSTGPGFTVPDLLSDQNLPTALPTFAGRLALDFVPTATPTGPLSYVFFDGLTVTAVPEPQSWALMAAGLALLAGVAGRRRVT